MSARGAFACPSCGKPNDAATGVGDDAAVPGPGDVLVCIGCAQPAVLVADGTLQPVLPDLLDDPGVRRTMRAVEISLPFPGGPR